MWKVLRASLITALLLTACATPQGKTTVIQESSPEPTAFVLPALPTPVVTLEYKERKKETPTVKVVEEVIESSVSPSLVSHMVENNLPEEVAKKYASYIIEASDEHSVDPLTVLAVMHVETGGTFKFKDHPNSHGAIGLMQVLQRNVKCNRNDSCTQDIWKGYSVQDLYVPKKNIELGTKYLKYLQDRFGEDLGILAYNQGEGNIAKGTYNKKYLRAVKKVLVTL